MQESLGFSPNELVFAHKVRGPLGALADNWKDVEPHVNLIDSDADVNWRNRFMIVSDFRKICSLSKGG